MKKKNKNTISSLSSNITSSVLSCYFPVLNTVISWVFICSDDIMVYTFFKH